MVEIEEVEKTKQGIGDLKSFKYQEKVTKPKTIRMSKKTDLSIKLASQVEDCNMGEIVEKAIDDFIALRHPDLVRIIDKN